MLLEVLRGSAEDCGLDRSNVITGNAGDTAVRKSQSGARFS